MNRDEHVLAQKSSVRWTRAAMYFGLVLSGIFATFSPSSLVEEQVGTFVVTLWAVSMMISAAICLYGSITDRWIGEYTGIPLLAMVLALYGLSAILAAGRDSVPLFAYGLVVISFSFGLIARWRDLEAIKNAPTQEGSEGGRGQ